jgi:hypothetical protein
MADITVYKNEDYTASRVKHEDGTVDYFIKYHFSTNPQEIKVDEREFLLYVGEFKRTMQRQTKAASRHISDKSLDDLETAKVKNPYRQDFMNYSDTRLSVEMVLQSCTEIQRRRFSLYYDCGYTFNEIAVIESRDVKAIFKSVNAVEEKIKNIFS